TMSDQLSMADLVKRTKKAYGMTWKEMAAQLGRSDRMIRKIANGETSGETFPTSITELYEKGQVETLTPRHRTKSGELARVRRKKGPPQKAANPVHTRRERAPNLPRGQYPSKTPHLPGRNRSHEIEMPKTRTSHGRKRGLQTSDYTSLTITNRQAPA